MQNYNLFFEMQKDYKKYFQKLPQPLFCACIAWHTPVAARGEIYRADLNAVKHTGTFELLCEKLVNEHLN